MRFLFCAATMATGLLALAWTNVIPPTAATKSEWDVPDPWLDSKCIRLCDAATQILQPLFGTWEPSVTASVQAALRRLLLLVLMLPLLSLVVGTGILFGLVLRESARTATRFSSPTFNYLGKRLATAALVVLPVIPLSPHLVSPWVCYLVGLLASFGAFLYVANLPVKI